MDPNKSATPPDTPSHSSAVSGSIEGMASSGSTTVPSTVPSAINFKPHQMLMQTAITIGCGTNAKIELTMHEEILRCHSKQLDRLYMEAQGHRQQYREFKTFYHKLGAYVFPEVTAKQFEEGGLEVQAKALLIFAYEKYPMAGDQTAIQRVIDSAVEELLVQKNSVKTAPLTIQHKRKSPTEVKPEMGLLARLDDLKSRGVQAVAERLYAKLHRITKREYAKAEKDPVRAAAHQRLLLPGVEEATVRSLVQWVYQGTLCHQNAAQLYNVMKLAMELGIDALGDKCLSGLYNPAKDSVHKASANGIPLRSLLGYGERPPDDLVSEVFKQVMQDDNAPKRLRKLVVDSLASSIDVELWQELRPVVSHAMALQVIDAMVFGRRTKLEVQQSLESKSEGMVAEQSSRVD